MPPSEGPSPLPFHLPISHSLRSRLPSPPLRSKSKGSLVNERRVPELIPVLCSQPAGDVSHRPGGGLPLLFVRPTVTLATLKRAATNFAAW